MSAKRSNRWFLGLKLTITVALLAYLAGKLDVRHIVARLLDVDPWFYAGAVAALAFPIMLTSLRWQLILRAQNIVLPLRSAASFDLIALFFNAFLPGSTGGDAARAYYAIARFPSEKTRIITSIFFDRGVGLMVLLVFGYFAMLAQPDVLAQVERLRFFVVYLPPVVAIAIFAFAVFFFLPSSRLPVRLHAWIHRAMDAGIFGRLLRFLRAQRSRPAILGAVLAISIVSYLFNFLSAYLLGRAMGLDVSYPQVIVMIAVLYTVISLPISFGGHGLREVVLIGLFSAFAIPAQGAESAVAFSLLLFSVQLIWSLVGGAWFLVWRGQSAEDGTKWLRTEP